MFLEHFCQILSAPFSKTDPFKNVFQDLCHLSDIMCFHFYKQVFQNLFSMGLHLIIFSHHIRVFLDRIIIDLLGNIICQNQFFKEFHDFFGWEIVWKLWELMQEINIFIEGQMGLAFQNFVYQEIHMMFLENMWNFLEQGIQRNSGFIITLLCHFEQFLKILDLKNALIDDVPKKALWLFDQLNMAVYQIHFFENLFLLYPFNLNVKIKYLRFSCFLKSHMSVI